MKRLSASLLGALLCLSLASHSLAQAGWGPQNYPNPVRSPQSCGRNLQSWICDPDRILSLESRNVVEGVIKLINVGEEPYAKTYCNGANTGFQVRPLSRLGCARWGEDLPKEPFLLQRQCAAPTAPLMLRINAPKRL